MTDAPPDEPSLAKFRAELDRIDHALIDLLAARQATVESVYAWKRSRGIAAIDAGRERALAAERRVYGSRAGVSQALVDAVFAAVLADSHARAR